MLFNSTTFVGFFFVVYGAYLLLGTRHRAQNVLLLGASYAFYGFWDWRFVLLLSGSSLVDFFVAKAIQANPNARARKRLLLLSICFSLSILGFFKYFNFFADNLLALLVPLGLSVDHLALKIVLPLGMSFYTFKEISYVVDVYRGRQEATANVVQFLLYVSFFPQLVAGPIERAKGMLPQIGSPRRITVTCVEIGLYLILWGFFKKLVIADNLKLIADQVFGSYADYRGLDLILGVLAYTFQIYCDFSGYSDIARGLAKLMGFDLPVNFRIPYASRSPSDFWQRWHVTLSEWLRDYLYISLGGNRKGSAATYRNLMATMLLGGLWHGAAWNYVVWGGYHGLLLVVYRVASLSPLARFAAAIPVAVRNCAAWFLMFWLTVLGWVFFRANSAPQIWHFLTASGFTISSASLSMLGPILFYTTPLIVAETLQQRSEDLLLPTKARLPLRTLWYAFILVALVVFGARGSAEFIYFQF